MLREKSYSIHCMPVDVWKSLPLIRLDDEEFSELNEKCLIKNEEFEVETDENQK